MIFAWTHSELTVYILCEIDSEEQEAPKDVVFFGSDVCPLDS